MPKETAEAVHLGLAALELTADQQKKMQDINAKHQKSMIDLRATQQKAQIDLRELQAKDDAKASDLNTKVDALMKAQGNIMKHEIKHRTDIKGILTPEQIKKMGEMRGNRAGMGFRGRGGQGFRGRGGHGFRGRGGPDIRGYDGARGFRGRDGFRSRRGTPQQPRPETQSGTMEDSTQTPAETSL